MAQLSSLPEEILLLIFEQLDSPPPSHVKGRQEPSLLLTTNTEIHYLKDISCTSRRFRRIVLPLLFRFSRMRLGVEPRDERAESITYAVDEQRSKTDSPSLKAKNAASHRATFDKIYSRQDPLSTLPQGCYRLHGTAYLHNCLLDYLYFVQHNKLASSVQSFALLTECFLEARPRSRFPHQNGGLFYQAAASFWYDLYSAIQPLRIVLVAPPADLACLTNCAVDVQSDWAFADMDFHILELTLDHAALILLPIRGDSSMEVIPRTYPGIADASLLRILPWSGIALNEGSFLKAYGTYEYFERGPPSLIYSIKNCLTTDKGLSSYHNDRVRDVSMRTFKYTAILPFASHIDFRDLLQDIEEFDVKLAPDPDFPLIDKDRIGKAELEDCWQEFFSAYRFIVDSFRTSNNPENGAPKMKRFICRDMHIPAIRPDLDDEFTGLCLPVWAEPEPGIFVRLQKSLHPVEEKSDV